MSLAIILVSKDRSNCSFIIDKHIGLCNNHLFLANDNEIKIINFAKPSGTSKGDVKVVESKPKEYTTFLLPGNNKLHGFFENSDSRKNKFLLMIIESSTHFLDFAKMTFG